MSTLHLPIVGTITPGEFYETSVTIQDRPVRIDFSLAELGALDPAVILALQDFLPRIERHAHAAKQAILRGFAEDHEWASAYVHHHLAHLGAEQFSEMIGVATGEATPELLVKHLSLERVLFPGEPDVFALFDFSVGRQYTDDVLTVAFDQSARITSIDMES